MLKLNESLFIAKGAFRATYNHPLDDTLCVKVDHDKNPRVALKRQEREIRYYQKLQRKKCPFRNISNFVGYVDTNYGQGYLYEKVVNHDGSPSQDLETVLEAFGAEGDTEILKDIKALGEFLLQHRIFYHDSLIRGNTLCRKRKDGSYELVIVDALGDTVFIPVLNYIPAYARARIIRKWSKYVINPMLKQFAWVKREDIALD